MSQHHFLIQYDTDTSSWEWDVETELAVMDGRTIYSQEEWIRPQDNKRLQTLDNEICEQLGSALATMNRRK